MSETFSIAAERGGSPDWPKERTERLQVLFNEGRSHAVMADKISTEFGIVLTRNATIGKCHRMGWTRSAAPGQGARIKKPKAEKRRPATRHRDIVRVVPNCGGGMRIGISRANADEVKLRCVQIVPLDLTLDELEPDHCRFPHGDVPFSFCGHPKQGGSSYCTPHHDLTHTAVREMSDDERARRSAAATRGHHAAVYIITGGEAA